MGFSLINNYLKQGNYERKAWTRIGLGAAEQKQDERERLGQYTSIIKYTSSILVVYCSATPQSEQNIPTKARAEKCRCYTIAMLFCPTIFYIYLTKTTKRMYT